MAIELLKLHWKAARWVLLPFLILAFGLPLAGGRGAWAAGRTDVGSWQVLELSVATGIFYPMLAALVGAVVALTAWNQDHQTGHVYALSLPVSRSRYAGLKFGVALLVLLLPTVALLAGALVSTGLMTLPPELEAYPLALTLHFLLASLTSFAFFFALAAGRMRTAIIVLGGLSALVAFGPALADFGAGALPGVEGPEVVRWTRDFLMDRPGPLKVFAGNWSIIDV